MKILSIQPGSLYQNGGAARVLRRLYQGKESQVYSLGVISSPTPIQLGNLKETLILAVPLQQKWMRWHLRTFVTWLRENKMAFLTINKIYKAAARIQYDAIHVVSHGPFGGAFNNDSLMIDKKLWVSFHDHFSTNGSSFASTGNLWNKAERCLVISKELGDEYQKLFGDREYELITDGVSKDEISELTNIDPSKPITIYFAGLLHIDYYPLFNILADALDSLSKKSYKFKLIMRGTNPVSFFNNRLFETEYRSNFVSDKEIKQELDSASILYLPIKFTLPDFYLYSLSTKMIGYLGASGTILYHGPANSAACNLLRNSKAAAICSSLDINDMIEIIVQLISDKNDYAANAKNVAHTDFNFEMIQQRFWQLNT
ncbi:glycosyltransferase [Mucilaginibacter sp.]